MKDGNSIWFLAGMAGVFLTGYYTSRLIFILLFPQETDRAEGTHGQPAHDHTAGARAMTLVLWILAGVTTVLGFGEGAIHHFLETALGAQGSPAMAHRAWLPLAAGLLAAAAIVLAWLEFD